MTFNSGKFWLNLNRLVQNKRYISTLLAICSIAVSIQLYVTTFTHPKEGWPTLYNNYVIFKTSFTHLVQGLDLYQTYPESYYDLYKYSPAFAVLMAPFSILPDILGLTLWNLVNTLVLIAGVRSLKGLSSHNQNFLLLFLLPELVISLQNAQSNALVCGLMLLALGMLEKQKPITASLMLALGTAIKIFPLAGFLLLLLFPNLVRTMAWSAFWLMVMFLIPLPFTGLDGFSDVYTSWINLLENDHSQSTGLSIFAWLNAWFPGLPDKNALLIIGLILLIISFIPALINRKYAAKPIHYLAILLIWIVIFNHKAESPTFILAMCGIGLWCFGQQITVPSLLIVVASIVLVSLSPTDLFPGTWKEGWVKTGVWKAFPCVLVWALISFHLLSIPFRKSGSQEKSTLPNH